MTDGERTNYVYEFTYSSAPGLREIFQCKYVSPSEALNRFKKILSLTEAPFDFKILVSDETMGEESSFQVKGGSMKVTVDILDSPEPGVDIPVCPHKAIHAEITVIINSGRIFPPSAVGKE